MEPEDPDYLHALDEDEPEEEDSFFPVESANDHEVIESWNPSMERDPIWNQDPDKFVSSWVPIEKRVRKMECKHDWINADKQILTKRTPYGKKEYTVWTCSCGYQLSSRDHICSFQATSDKTTFKCWCGKLKRSRDLEKESSVLTSNDKYNQYDNLRLERMISDSNHNKQLTLEFYVNAECFCDSIKDQDAVKQGRKRCSVCKNKTLTVQTVSAPTVVRIKRSKGKVEQDCTLYIGRSCYQGGWQLPASKWENPFSVSKYGRDQALEKYREYILGNKELMDSLPELAGQVLGCWCKPDPCHGDILVELFEKYCRNAKVLVPVEKINAASKISRWYRQRCKIRAMFRNLRDNTALRKRKPGLTAYQNYKLWLNNYAKLPYETDPVYQIPQFVPDPKDPEKTVPNPFWSADVPDHKRVGLWKKQHSEFQKLTAEQPYDPYNPTQRIRGIPWMCNGQIVVESSDRTIVLIPKQT